MITALVVTVCILALLALWAFSGRMDRLDRTTHDHPANGPKETP